MTDGITLAVALLGIGLLVAALVGLRALRRSVTDLRVAVDDLSRGAATVDAVQVAVQAAVRSAIPATDEAPATATVDASRVPALLRTGPVIKAMALGSGTAHAARRLRGNGSNGRSTH